MSFRGSIRRVSCPLQGGIQQQHRRVRYTHLSSVFIQMQTVFPLPYCSVGGAYGSLARCGVLPVMSRDTYIITIDEGSGVRGIGLTG